MDKKNHEADFEYISEYLLSVFEFASISKNTIFDKAEWLSFSPADGRWLYTLYKKDTKNGESMRQAIDRLFKMEAGQRCEIYKAIAHDMQFAGCHTKGFEFKSISLDKASQEIIEDFFLYFYKVVLCSAHFKLSGLTQTPFGRKEFVEEFFEGKNKIIEHICPVCLQPMTNMRKEGDIEHYFAKTLIPCLALHPYNIYFICPACNQRYKKIKGPLYGGNKDIRKVFLPYMDTIRDKVNIEFKHEKEADCVKLSPADAKEAYIDEKLEAFDHLFELEERWSGLLEYYHSTRRIQYEALNPCDVTELQREMEHDLAREKAYLMYRPDRYLETQYLDWISHSQLKAFYSDMAQDGDTAVIIY